MIFRILFAHILLFALFSCRSEQTDSPQVETGDKLSISVYPEFNGDKLYLDSVYTTFEGYEIKFTEIKFYFEELMNGDSLFKDAGLFDYRLKGNEFIERVGDKSSFSSLDTYLGVSSHVNHLDPSAFPIESDLNILQANDMHWHWNPGYIFVKIEAKLDTIQDGNALFDHNLVFHVGKDENIRNLTLENLNWNQISDKDYNLSLILDMSKFLHDENGSIDAKVEYTSHVNPGEEALSSKIMDRFAASIKPN